MAIYTGPLPINGRLDELSFYNVEGQIRVRVRRPLSRKRVIKGPEFRNTMIHAAWMARASKIGSAVYQALPENFRQFWMYKAFVGEAITLLKQGMPDEDARFILWKTYAEVWQIKKTQENETARAEVSQNNSLQISYKASSAGKTAVTRLVVSQKEVFAAGSYPKINLLRVSWCRGTALLPKIRPAPFYPERQTKAGR
ncbi:MAG: hypothetical protein J7527_09920 [Chitinophagaceae bacterium]|nr:hypothetical protein [Chitinophagaceae bacterium]